MKKFRFPVLFYFSLGLLASCDEPSEKTITLQPNGSNGKDAALFNCVPCNYTDRNFGTQVEFSAIAGTNNSAISNVRSLIQFDLSTISKSSKIKEAKLSLFHFTSTNGNHLGVNGAKLLKITSAWEESTVTWNNQPATTTEGSVSLAASENPTQDYLDIDVTALVQSLVSNPESDFGFMLKLDTETAYRSMIFASSDNTNEGLRPMLVVTYETK